MAVPGKSHEAIGNSKQCNSAHKPEICNKDIAGMAYLYEANAAAAEYIA
jgi:hypothetical protein